MLGFAGLGYYVGGCCLCFVMLSFLICRVAWGCFRLARMLFGRFGLGV